MNSDKLSLFSGGRAKIIVLPALFLLLLFSLGACGGGGNAESDAAVLTGKLACAEECVLYGQCGVNQENVTVILGNSGQPETRNHNMTLPNDTAVTILSEQQKLTLFPETQTEAPELFYQVQTGDGATTGWVAAWCVVANE